jgi:hypothetical protein
MPRERERRIIFLSHAQSDFEAAKTLKDWLLYAFSNNVQVFASSDWQSIEMGMDWYETIDRALRDSTLGLLLITENSIQRPWVNYELGALRAARKKTVPVCIGRVTKASLPSPFSHAHACDYDRRDDRLDLLRSIASTFGFPTDWVPVGAVDNAPSLHPGPIKQPNPVTAGHGLAIEYLFKSADRWTTVVYTCRATFTGEHCMPTGPIKKSLWAHIPVDEVQTVCVAVNHLMPAELRAAEDDILQTVICSMQAEHLLLSQLTDPGSAVPFSPLFNRDLVVVGENNFSNLLLQMTQAYLPWHAGWEHIARRTEKPRPHVYVELVPRFNAPVPPGQKGELHRGGAMVALFPNPFNIRKKVLILFGCHRQGQFTLEDWLRGAEVRDIVDAIAKSGNKGSVAVQILIDRTLVPTDGDVQPVAVAAEAIRNLSDGKQFWCTQLNRVDIGEVLTVNAGHSTPQSLYDVSIVVPLPACDQAQLEERLRSSLGLADLYWERDNCEIGFHVTLYEFLTHRHPDAQLLKHLEDAAQRICDALGQAHGNELPDMTTARLRGIEVLPAAVISYVDFLDKDGSCSNWLDSLRRWCEKSASRAGLGARTNLLNAMRVPFPAHTTICRFSREIAELEEGQLWKVANESRGLELLRFPIDNVALTIATKSPYRSVRVVKTFPLTKPAP